MIYSACIAHAASAYHVPITQVEHMIESQHEPGGVGAMGIPPEWLPILARVGFSRDSVVDDPCTNIEAGSWVMAYELEVNPKRKGAPTPALPGGSSAASTSDLPPTCEDTAARRYQLPIALLKGILATEGGHIGTIHWNGNGSYDMGIAQVNSIWLPQLEAAGITPDMVINDGCLNVTIGAWILAQDMQGADPSKPAQFWQHVGDYNSQTPLFNQRYQRLVWSHVVNAAP